MTEQSTKSVESAPEQPKLPVDEGWLTELLNSKCSAKGVLAGYSCRGIAEGKGFLSVITRVHLDWNKEKSQGVENLPTDIIIKKPTVEKLHSMDEKMKEMFNMDMLIDVHKRECQAYSFFNKHSPPPFPMARFFYSEEITPTVTTGILILEDLTEQAISLDFVDDATIEQVYELAEQVANLQAYGLNNPDAADYIMPMERDPFEDMCKDIGHSMDLIRVEYPGELRWSNEEFEALIAKRHKICPMFAKPEHFPISQVVALGDVQPNNILWHRSGPHNDQPSSKVAAFIDFQAAHIGNCMIDIANTMTQSLPTDVRRANTDLVIDRYLTQLRAKTHGDVPVTKVEAKRLQLEMMFQYAAMTVCMYPMFPKMLSMNQERKVTMFHRFLACVEDALAELENC